MAIGKYSRKKQIKNENEQSLCRCVVTLFQVVVFFQNVSCIAAQGYMPLNVEAENFIKDLSAFSGHEVNTEIVSGTVRIDPSQIVSTQADVIRFEPPYLDFDTQPLGMPENRIVYIYNPSKTKSLRLTSISAKTLHFHSSFFDKKVIPPNSNTSFEVVFLARAVGNVENTLFINTVIGTFSYQVFGVGIPSPYGLRPYLGAKVSLNSSFSPLISMHNPTGTPLQVLEMYTSSGHLHLQLPTGSHTGSKKIWEIPPYESRDLMQASFLGQVADNHTAFIRIKTNQTDHTKYLILPMEVEVSSVPGIYSSLEMLDFGTLRSKDKPKVLNLFLLNFGSKEVQVSSVAVQPANLAIEIDFRPTRLKPSEALYTRVANVSFDVTRSKDAKQWNGHIVVKTKEKSYSKLSIPYQATILDGNLGYDEEMTYFRVILAESDPVSSLRNISLTNTFAFPIILHKVKLPDNAGKFFEIVNFTSPCIIPTQDTVTCFMVKCTTSVFHAENGRKVDVTDTIHHLVLHTNASTFSMPLHAYTGLLSYKVQKANAADIDFGILGTMDKRQMILTIYNHNPLPVKLFDCNTTLNGVAMNLVSLTKEDKEIDTIVRSQRQNIFLPAQSCLVVEVILTAPKTETTISGTIDVYTEFETLRILVKGIVAVGSFTIKPSKIKFRPSFPGMVVYHTVSITSSFAQTARIEGLTSTDKRLYYRKHKNVGVDLEPGKEVKAGKVYFDARQTCKSDRCYVGLPTSTTVGHHWLTTMNLGLDSVVVDTKLYKTHRGLWKDLQDSNSTLINSSFRFNTSLRVVDLPATASLYWPSLLSEPVHEFPLTLIDKKSVSQITLRNPSDSPVIVQILPLSLYPQPLAAVRALEMQHLLEDDGFVLDNRNIFNVSMNPDSSAEDKSAQMVWLEYTLNRKINRSCVNLFLNPGQKQKINVTFYPKKAQSVSTLILIRNNLTLVEHLLVKGRGVQERLKLGGKLSGRLNESLRFKLTEKLLQDCHVEKRKDKSSPSFTVRKSFIAKNLGLLELEVRHMMIDNFPCEGYGFRILGCERFLLQPNETKEIMIAFTPDFTSSQILHRLRLRTSQNNNLTFNLNVTLPHHLLPVCQASIPRPPWEWHIHASFTLIAITTFLGIIIFAYMEADNFIEPHRRSYETEYKLAMESAKRDKTRVQGTPFNLQSVAANYNQNPIDVTEATMKRLHRNHNSHSTSQKIMKKMRLLLDNVLSFDLLQFLKKSPRRSRVRKSSSSEEDPENVVRSLPEVTSTSLHNQPVANPISARSKHKQPRKSKPVHTSSWRQQSSVKLDSHSKLPNGDSIERSWSQEASSLDKTIEKVPDDSKASTDSLSVSSVESSSSRGSVTSSAPNESDGCKLNLNKLGVVNRKRKNKSNRQQASYANDADDSSSTTTEKSCEDFDKKISFNNFSTKDSKKKHNPSKSSSPKHKSSFDSDSLGQSISLPYTLTNEQGMRRRHTRSSAVPSLQPQGVSSHQSKPIKKAATLPTYYDTTSSTDEPTWSKGCNPKQDVDEVMRNISEQTRQIDGTIRSKTPRTKKPATNKTSSHSNVVTSSNEAVNRKPPAKSSPPIPSRNQSLVKALSVPNEIFGRETAPSSFEFDNSSPNSRRHSNNDTDNTFSVFTSTGARSNQANPPLLSPTSNLPAWNNFGQNSFSITEGLLSNSTRSQASIPTIPVLSSAQWQSYIPATFSTSPSRWPLQDNVLNLNLPPPSSPTSPKTSRPSSESPNWGNSSSPVSRSTHAIWSVSNAVTMDEDRNTAESDPLGLKSIWNSDLIEEEEANNNDLF